MMRVVFLLFAEERGLLPTGELFEQGYGIAGELDRLQARETQESEEALDSTFLTWHRLLATSQAVYRGATFESMRMPAYGGSLFDPARFAFLTDTTEQGMLALTVSDRVMLHVLRSVQQAILRGGEARRISFRDIDVEQIGYIYEGLLGYTASPSTRRTSGCAEPRAKSRSFPFRPSKPSRSSTATRSAGRRHPRLGRAGPARRQTSVGRRDRESHWGRDRTRCSQRFDPDPSAHDRELRERILPWLPLVRHDLRGRPLVMLDGGLMVKETPSRRNSGTHYTPSHSPKKSCCMRCSRCATRRARIRPPTRRSGSSSLPTKS